MANAISTEEEQISILFENVVSIDTQERFDRGLVLSRYFERCLSEYLKDTESKREDVVAQVAPNSVLKQIFKYRVNSFIRHTNPFRDSVTIHPDNLSAADCLMCLGNLFPAVFQAPDVVRACVEKYSIPGIGSRVFDAFRSSMVETMIELALKRELFPYRSMSWKAVLYFRTVCAGQNDFRDRIFLGISAIEMMAVYDRIVGNLGPLCFV